MDINHSVFPKNFFWGGALSARQAEGAWNVDGRGESVNDHLTLGTKASPRIFTEVIDSEHIYPTQYGADFYHHYKEDIALFAEMGYKMFRLSLSWTRIYPNGDDAAPNREGIAFYRSVFQELRKYGIEPLVTISHGDMPYALAKKYDGWLNRKCIDFFSNYVTTLFNEYKGLVKYWITFNEINTVTAGMPFYKAGIMSTARKNLDPSGLNLYDNEEEKRETQNKQYNALHNMLVASAKAVRIGHEINPENKIGGMLCGLCQYPYSCNPDDVILTQKNRRYNYYFAGDVQVWGEYPCYTERMLNEMGVTLQIQPEDLRILKAGTVDFYSLSYYGSGCSTVDESIKKTAGNCVFGTMNPYLKTSHWGWQIDPQGIRFFLNDMYDRYRIPLMIVENGLGQDDVLESDHTVHDDYRIEYHREHIKQLAEAVKDGVDLLAYTTWGCIDFTASSTGEMAKRYGFIYVDAKDGGIGTFKRYKKDSFYWYKKVIASNGANLD